MDPHKIRFIDNKRISIIIGCVAGILVFIFIIISIVMNREEKEDETPEAENESLSGSAATAHKSPGSKTNRSDSLGFTPRLDGQVKYLRRQSLHQEKIQSRRQSLYQEKIQSQRRQSLLQEKDPSRRQSLYQDYKNQNRRQSLYCEKSQRFDRNLISCQSWHISLYLL